MISLFTVTLLTTTAATAYFVTLLITSIMVFRQLAWLTDPSEPRVETAVVMARFFVLAVCMWLCIGPVIDVLLGMRVFMPAKPQEYLGVITAGTILGACFGFGIPMHVFSEYAEVFVRPFAWERKLWKLPI